MIIKILDILISSFIVTPLLICFWWGTWSYEVYSNRFPLTWSLYFSTILVFVFTLLREPLYEKRMSGVLGLLIARLYIYAFAIACITQWYAMFAIMDQFMTLSMTVISVVVSVFLMSYLRTLTTLQGPPYFLFLDHKRKTVFIYPTMFQRRFPNKYFTIWRYNSERREMKDLLFLVWPVCCVSRVWWGAVARLSSSVRMRGSTAGITDGLRGTSPSYYLFITFLDSLLSALVISPLVVSYWRGTWELMGHYVYHNELKKSSGVSLLIGLIGIMLFTMTQKCYPKILNPNEHRIFYYVISRVYTACFGFVCVNSWRGAWLFLDACTSTDPQSVILITCASIIVLLFTKTIRNISAPPFAIVTDRYEGYFDVPTHLKASSENFWFYLVDCVFSVCVIGMLVVFVWRGTWTLLDIFLYPENSVLSAWMSLGIGYTIVGITFALQPPIKYLANELSGILRMVVVDIYLIFSFCGTVNVWRGIWKIQDLYFFPDKPELSYALSHFVPFLLLVLINSSNSILVRGVYIDGEEAGSQCVDFPCYYLRLIFQSKRKEKIIREAEKRAGEKEEQKHSEGEVLIQIGVNPVDEGWKNKSINNFCPPELTPH